MLGARLLTALLGAPLLLAATWAGGWIFQGLVALLGALIAAEAARLVLSEQPSAARLTALSAAVAILATPHSPATPLALAWGAPILALLLVTLAPRLIGRRTPPPLWSAPALAFVVLYAGVALGHLVLLRQWPGGWMWCLYVFLVTWATDTGAYAIGLLIGRHPLAPAISPKKSIEGALGGLFLAGLVGALFGHWAPSPALHPGLLALLALLLGAIVQIGDLFESALKRGAGVKDSGKLLPGHGGLLDRFDGMLWAAPACYYVVVGLQALHLS